MEAGSDSAHGCLGLAPQQSLAFRHCTRCERATGNNFKVHCGICNWTGTTNDTKMIGRHYLRVSNQMGKACIPLEELKTEQPNFVNELNLKWQVNNSSASHTPALKRHASNGLQSGTGSKLKRGKIDQQLQKRVVTETTVRESWDNVFFKKVPFNLADDPDFRHAVTQTSFCPGFKINCAKKISTDRLDARDEQNIEWSNRRLLRVAYLGSSFHSDGWRSKRKRKYHNFILLTPDGPVFLEMRDVTGNSGSAEAIADEIEEVINKLDPEVRDNLILGLTDTPSANRAAWKLLEERFPGTIWAGCMAHEVSLLFKDYKKKIPELSDLFDEGKALVKWINNHDDVLELFRALAANHYKGDKQAAAKSGIGLYMPGDTRMATLFITCDRLLKLKLILQGMVHQQSLKDGDKNIRLSYDDMAQKNMILYKKQYKNSSGRTATNCRIHSRLSSSGHHFGLIWKNSWNWPRLHFGYCVW